MKTPLYSMYDKRRQTFGPLMSFENDDVAVRSMRQFIAAHPDSVAVTTPEDFALYHLGYFNDSTGDISPVDDPETSIVVEMKFIAVERTSK